MKNITFKSYGPICEIFESFRSFAHINFEIPGNFDEKIEFKYYKLYHFSTGITTFMMKGRLFILSFGSIEPSLSCTISTSRFNFQLVGTAISNSLSTLFFTLWHVSSIHQLRAKVLDEQVCFKYW